MRDLVFAGGTAVVTGAAGGAREALARALARRGSHLVLLDRDGDRLAGVAAAVRAEPPALRAATHVVDLADAAATARAADAVLAGAAPTLLVDPAWRSAGASTRWGSTSSRG